MIASVSVESDRLYKKEMIAIIISKSSPFIIQT